MRNIFERRVPLTEKQTEEVRHMIAEKGHEQLSSIVGRHEGKEGTSEEEGLRVALDRFFQQVIERAHQREFFSGEERRQLTKGLSEALEPLLRSFEEQDQRRLQEFVGREPLSVKETLYSLDEDIVLLQEQIHAKPDDKELKELESVKEDLEFFRADLWRQVQLGYLRSDDVMSKEECEAFAGEVTRLESCKGIGATGKSVAEFARETAESMVDEYHRLLVGHKILLALEASYSEAEFRAHLKEAVPADITVNVDVLWKEMNERRGEDRPEAISKFQLYGKVMMALFKDRKLMASGLTGGVVLLGYLAPQMAGRFGEFGRTGTLGVAVEGAGFGVASSITQVELSRRLSLFLNERLYSGDGLAQKITESITRSSPELFAKRDKDNKSDRAMLRAYVEDAISSIESIAQTTIEGLATHLCQAVGLGTASAMRLNNPALFGPVVLAAAMNVFIARGASRSVSQARNEARQASASFAKRLDEAMEIRASRGSERSVEQALINRLKEAQDHLVQTASKYQQGGGLVMPLVLLLNAFLMDRGKPDFFAEYAEGSMYSMQLSQALSSLASDASRIGQALDPLHRLVGILQEFHEGGDVMPEKGEVEFVDVRYKKLQVPSLKISPGELVLVAGESGAGKSSLLELLYGFTPDRGLTLIDEVPKSDIVLRAYREGITVANQFYAIETASFIDNLVGPDIPFDADVFREVIENFGFEPWMRQVAKADLTESVESIGRRLILNKDAELSGGERKKFSLLAMDYRLRVAPDSVKMLLLDEPTSGADKRLKKTIFKTIAGWRKAYPDKTVVIVNHDPELFSHLPEESRVLGIEADGRLTQDESLASAREHEGMPFHHVFVEELEED